MESTGLLTPEIVIRATALGGERGISHRLRRLLQRVAKIYALWTFACLAIP